MVVPDTVRLPDNTKLTADICDELAAVLTELLPIEIEPGVSVYDCVVLASCICVAVYAELTELLPINIPLVLAMTLAPTYAVVVTDTAVELINELPSVRLVGVSVAVPVLLASATDVCSTVALTVALPTNAFVVVK